MFMSACGSIPGSSRHFTYKGSKKSFFGPAGPSAKAHPLEPVQLVDLSEVGPFDMQKRQRE
jgi:hypothetical protein